MGERSHVIGTNIFRQKHQQKQQYEPYIIKQAKSRNANIKSIRTQINNIIGSTCLKHSFSVHFLSSFIATAIVASSSKLHFCVTAVAIAVACALPILSLHEFTTLVRLSDERPLPEISESLELEL